MTNRHYSGRQEEALVVTRVCQKWRLSAPQIHLRFIKVWFSAGTFVVKIATFATPKPILDTDPFAAGHKVIYSSIRFNDRFERLRLRTHSKHQSDFDTIILNGDTTKVKKPTKVDLRKDEPKFKFINTANFFTNCTSSSSFGLC